MTAALALLVTVATAPSAGREAALSAAKRAYLAGDYAGAERGFATALAFGDGPELEYDLGTAAAQAGDLGTAVLHLERALRLAPWDADARRNLERIREKRLDKVVGQELGEAPLQRLIHGLPGGPLGWTSALLWALGFGLLIARRRSFGALAFASLALALLAFGLAWATGRSRALPYAVVTAKVVPVRPGPDPSLTPSFEVHAGLKVLLEEEEGDLARIRLANGLEGWVPSPAVERI